MQKKLFTTVWILVALCLMGFGGNDLFSTIQKSFYYRDETVNMALKYKNTDSQMRIVKFASSCHSSFRIFDSQMKQVYPLVRSEVKCVNFQKDYVALAPNQNLVFRLSLDAAKLANGKYFVQGLASGFRPGKLMKFEVLNRPKITSGLNQSCGKAINKNCDFGLKCNFENSRALNLGVCQTVLSEFSQTPPSQLPSPGLTANTRSLGQLGAAKLRTGQPGLTANTRSLGQLGAAKLRTGQLGAGQLGAGQTFGNRQVLRLENVDYFSTDPLSVSEFKKLVFEKTFKKIDLVDSNNLLTKQQSVYLLYHFLYSDRYPRSLNGLFFLDTIGAKYTDYIDAAASLGVVSMSDKYFYPFDLVTQGEVSGMIDKFLAIRI